MASNITKSFTVGCYTYEQTLIHCGKEHCHKCPHGPYWYMRIKLAHGKSTKKYLGKSLPEGITAP